MPPQQPSRNVRHQFHCPPELEGGVYANMVTVWHTGHEFTIDFAASMPAKQRVDDSGEPTVVVPQKITARVKIPPTMLFEIVRALDANLQRYEERYGPVTRPGDQDTTPLLPPDDWVPDLDDDDGSDGDDHPGPASDDEE